MTLMGRTDRREDEIKHIPEKSEMFCSYVKCHDNYSLSTIYRFKKSIEGVYGESLEERQEVCGLMDNPYCLNVLMQSTTKYYFL